MKRNFFTLICLSLLLSSVSVSLFAQTVNQKTHYAKDSEWPIDPSAIVSGFVGGGEDSIYTRAPYDFVFDGASMPDCQAWMVFYSNTTPAVAYDSVKFTVKNNAGTATITFNDIPLLANGKQAFYHLGFAVKEITATGIGVVETGTVAGISAATATIYNTPRVTVDYSPITALYGGKADIYITNWADTALLRSINGGLTWVPVFIANPDGTYSINHLTSGEIEVLGDYILFKQPGAKGWITVSIKDEDNPSENPPALTRIVAISNYAGVTTSIGSGVHRVEFGKDFEFFVAVAEGLKPVVTTDPSYETEVTKVEGGTWKVVIKAIEKAINVDIATVVDGIEEVTGASVYGAAGQVYITGATGVAKVYGITGALVKTVAVGGTSTVSLPAGLYIVSLDGKAYKVVVK